MPSRLTSFLNLLHVMLVSSELAKSSTKNRTQVSSSWRWSTGAWRYTAEGDLDTFSDQIWITASPSLASLLNRDVPVHRIHDTSLDDFVTLSSAMAVPASMAICSA